MKKILIVVATLVTSASLHAGLLNWQVGAGAEFRDKPIMYGNLYNTDGDFIQFAKAGAGVMAADIASGMTYYVEFCNYEGATIAFSDQFTYGQLVEGGWVTDSEIGVAAMATWTPEPVAAPEPTSAMMMLFGVAFLGLKRRKA